MRVDQRGQHQMVAQLFREMFRRIVPGLEAQVAHDDAALDRTGNGYIAQNDHSS